MASDFFDMLTEQPVLLAEAPVSIRDADVAGVPDGAAPQAQTVSYPRPYANEAANSRSAGTLPEGLWEVRWRTELTAGLDPMFVLHEKGAILLPGPFQWQLFDAQGASQGVGALGVGQAILDTEHDLFLGPGRTGVVTGWSLANGTRQFSLLIATDDSFRQALLARREGRLLVLSVGYKGQPHGGQPPEEALLEVYTLGPAEAVDAVGFLRGARVQARLRRESPLLLAALHEDTVVLAAENQIILADWTLRLTTALEETFIPLAMSLDEAGRIYVVVLQRADEAPERRALWVLTPDGQRLVDVTLPEAESDAYTPPIVGYDHRVHLFQGEHIVSVGADGTMQERQYAGGPIAGGLATADGWLIVAAGGLLSAFDADGERRVIHLLEDDQWVTPPVLTSRGRILVASERYLYCLQVTS